VVTQILTKAGHEKVVLLGSLQQDIRATQDSIHLTSAIAVRITSIDEVNFGKADGIPIT